MTVSGHSGELKYSYQLAAVLENWMLRTIGPTASRKFELTASVSRTVEPWFNRLPLDLYLSCDGKQWVWNGISDWTKSTDNEKITIHLEGTPAIIKGASNE
jgi:hypothetical protein